MTRNRLLTVFYRAVICPFQEGFVGYALMQVWMELLALMAEHPRSQTASFPIPITEPLEEGNSLILKLSAS